MNKHTWFGSENLELELTEQQFMSIKHNGEDCSPQIEIIRKDPMIEEQLQKLNPKDVLEYLIEQGCWERFELNQHEHNLNKIVWIACEDTRRELYEESRKK